MYSKTEDPEPMSESDDNNLIEESKFAGHTKPMSEIESELESNNENVYDEDTDDEDEIE